MRKLKLSAVLVFCLSILFLFFFQYCKHARGLGDANPFGEDPYDAVGSFGVLLAPLAAGFMLVRAFRPYTQNWADAGQLLLILRSGLVSLLAMVVTLISDAIGLVRSILISGVFPAAVPLAGLVGGMSFIMSIAAIIFVWLARGLGISGGQRPWGRAALVGGLAIIFLALYPQGWREGSIPGGIFTALFGMALLFIAVWAFAEAILPGHGNFSEDVFDDLAAVFLGLKQRLRALAFPLVWLERLFLFPAVKKLLDWFRPRKHRWHLVLLVAVLFGPFLFLLETIVEGFSPNLGRFLLVVGVYIGIGGIGVLLGYVLLGEYLGIY